MKSVQALSPILTIPSRKQGSHKHLPEFYSTMYQKIKNNIGSISAFWAIQKPIRHLGQVSALLACWEIHGYPTPNKCIRLTVYTKLLCSCHWWWKKLSIRNPNHTIRCSHHPGFRCMFRKLKQTLMWREWLVIHFYSLTTDNFSWILILAPGHSWFIHYAAHICDMDTENPNGQQKKRWKTIAHNYWKPDPGLQSLKGIQKKSCDTLK